MSANPEAFNHLRQAAYRFVQRHGKDGRQLHDHCVTVLASWREGDGAGSGLTDAEASQIVEDVTRWTINRYNPPQRKAERSREERAVVEIAAPVLLEFAAETFGAATVRNAARIGGQSKTTVARHLRQQGIAPKRQKKIQSLPPRVRWLAEILDATFPNDGEDVLMMDQLAAAVWDRSVAPLPETARSTLATRRKKLSEYLSAISNAGIGFHLVAAGDAVAVRRGRRFHGLKDTVTWVDDQRKRRGTRGIVFPSGDTSQWSFWEDRWLQDVLAVLRISRRPYFTNPAELEPLLRLRRTAFDVRPLYHLFEIVIQRSMSGNFDEDLEGLAKRVRDPNIRKAANQVSYDISRLSLRRDQELHPIAAFDEADRHMNFMVQAREKAPESYARLGYFKAVILKQLSEEFDEMLDRVWRVIQRCNQLAELEKRGEWKAPSEAELAPYRVENEPPF